MRIQSRLKHLNKRHSVMLKKHWNPCSAGTPSQTPLEELTILSQTL